MASKILIKKSSTASAVPSTSDLDIGELAVNTHDKRVFTKHGGAIVELGITPSSVTTGVITASSGTVSGNWTVSGTLTVATPSNSTDAASKGYVDTAVSNLVDAAPGALDTLNELAAAIGDDANFSTTITNSLATKLGLSGGTMTGDIVLGANKITSTATPATDDTLTRKGYVDSILGSATSAATSAANAATSESNAATSATNAATSASNASTSENNAGSSASAASTSATSASNSATAAATSATTASTAATNAAASYDSFDDRYLGAKSSDPTLDNDGDALLTGALYFNSTSGDFKVYNGSAWQITATTSTDLVNDTTPQLGGTLDLNGNSISGTLVADGLTIDTTTLVVDSVNNRVGIGTASPSEEFHVYSASSGKLAVFESTSGTGGAGPSIDLKRSSASPAANDYLTYLNFVGKDSGGNDTNYVGLAARIVDPTDTSEDGRFIVETRQAGSPTNAILADTDVELYSSGSKKFETTTSGVSVTGRATGTQTTDNDLSFDMTASNQFKCTPTSGAALTFTNITAGQSGNIFLDNSAGVTITAAATTKINSTDLTTISTAGTYFLSYYSDGTNVLVATSQSVTA